MISRLTSENQRSRLNSCNGVANSLAGGAALSGALFSSVCIASSHLEADEAHRHAALLLAVAKLNTCHLEIQYYPGPRPLTTAQPNRAAEALHDPLDQHQPHPNAALLGGEKWPERQALLLFIHALASVRKPQAQAAAVVAYHFDP
ncbi:hypothetical protein WR25_13421 [Diploscapter pachys]|uniref:Uncharacterized protein n=1 Tax=Diploscapter pachys TaxID=2018661 RepID=A0A2A2KBX9_9BILA|nr:hypothetical protein WR25_13421 [Diploscapter pachys]